MAMMYDLNGGWHAELRTRMNEKGVVGIAGSFFF
jgi:hypothetical protein